MNFETFYHSDEKHDNGIVKDNDKEKDNDREKENDKEKDKDNGKPLKKLPQRTTLETFVKILTLDGIRNSCDVCCLESIGVFD